MSAAFARLDSCQYLLLRTISEPTDNELRSVVEEARPEESESVEPEGPVSGARQVTHHAGCRIFELVWSTYIAYGVRNERLCLR